MKKIVLDTNVFFHHLEIGDVTQVLY